MYLLQHQQSQELPWYTVNDDHKKQLLLSYPVPYPMQDRIILNQETNQQKEVMKMNENNMNINEPASDAAQNETSAPAAPSKDHTFNITKIDDDAFKITDAGEGKTVRESTTGDTAKLFNAVSGASDPVKELLGKEVEVTDIVVTSTDVHEIKDDEESPIINRPVVHFYTTDKKHYASLSNGIVRTTKALLECGIVPTPENPIKIKFRTVETRKGTAHIFELA